MPSHEIPLSRPDISEVEESLVIQTLRSGRLSIGPMTAQFERSVAARVGRSHAVAVNSGTSGLHLIVNALGIGPGDEVITTPFSFIASANCILYAGATPVFVDICPKTLNMDPAKLEAAIGPRTKAIIAVETFGNPWYMDQYEQIAARHEVPLIEDCCEALGTSHKGRPCGSFGRIGVFGFYPNKQITTGEGGMIVTDDHRLAELCRSMRNQGRPLGWQPPPMSSRDAAANTRNGESVGGVAAGSWLRHERLGYNYRLSEVNAALGVAQMRRLDSIVQRRNDVAQRYISRLAGNPHLIMPTLSEDTAMSWFVFVVRLSTTYTQDDRDRIIKSMRNHDVGAGDYFPCIHLQPFYREQFGFRPGMFPIAESVSQRTIALPFYNDLSPEDAEHVCATLELMIKRENLRRN